MEENLSVCIYVYYFSFSYCTSIKLVCSYVGITMESFYLKLNFCISVNFKKITEIKKRCY